MKKFLFLGIILILAGCSKSKSGNLSRFLTPSEKVKVLSTTAMIGDIVQKVGGEHVDHLILIVGEVDPHSYELVKGDDEKIDFADIVFYNGLGLEHGASLQYRLQNHRGGIPLGDRLREKFPDRILFVDGQIDPHIWMDVSLWRETIPLIAQELSEKDPAHAEYFQENARSLMQELEKLDNNIYSLLQLIPDQRRFLVTSHDAFNYFAKRYLSQPGEEDWQKRFAAPEGLAPDGQLSVSHIQKIIDHLLQYQISVVFPESNVSKDSLRKIQIACKEKGICVQISSGPLFGDAMDHGDSYLMMMQKNAEVIQREINESESR